MFQTLACSLPKVALALAIMTFTIISGDILRQCAAKIGEPVDCTESLTVDCNVGLNIGFPWGRLVQYFSLLYADGETEVCAGYGKCVYSSLHISF